MNIDCILRINNQKHEHSNCALASGRMELSDFAFLAHAFKSLSDKEIEPYLHLVDLMRKTDTECFSCSAKIVAFCEIFCSVRSLLGAELYQEEYESTNKTNRDNRDYRAEIQQCIEKKWLANMTCTNK